MTASSTTPQATPAPTPSMSGRSRRGSRFQPEIQGLRALAVLLVVAYHFWPERLPGGYVGVDVFFVISGYLITAHLFKEAARTGTLKLGQFWARRIRRLLPLSLLVLLVTAVTAVLVLPSTAWQSTLRQIVASTLYVQNWILAADSVEYSKLDEQATAVQHFWSLSVEEQFYVLWPLLLVLALLVTRARVARTPQAVRTTFIAVLSVLGVASFVFSVWYTGQDPAQAYFVTPTRIWEFALGALLALVMGSSQFTGRLADLLGWLGLAMILSSAWFYSETTAFPGWAALLPTVGTVLILMCGGRGAGTGIHWWLSRRPATAVGDWSYAIYLWHWPVVIFSPYLSDEADRWYVKGLLILAVIGLSAFSTRYVETPLRRARLLRPTWGSLVAAAAGMALVISTAHVAVAAVERGFADTELSEDHPCYGYAALANPDQCGDPLEGDLGLMPNPAQVTAQNSEPAYPDCQAETDAEGIPECWLGAGASAAEGTIAVVGDSHATMWLPALDEIAQEHHKRLLVLTRSACTPRAGEIDEDSGECARANAEIVEKLAQDEDVETVVIAASQMHSSFGDPGTDLDLPAHDIELTDTARAMYAPIDAWLEAGKEVAVFGEVPRMNKESQEEQTLPECVALHEDDVTACDDDLEDTRVGDRWLTRSDEVFGGVENFHFVPTEDLLCDEVTCHAVLGGAITFRDNSHLSENFVRSVTDEIGQRLEDAILSAD
ncbi:acyltransferase family protein [Nesterenkonia sp. HG001]|uniref:acyltransferase family protein n=1 Tax=Nesterenkonia sp. HG001 TaxID=2983207 RepID=UPI002AC6AE5F|nr:acyltransferase family protein [Nesterenkonia sp. HG001]MDZ5078540.1 acyltransferase [Nesterenkonia sp. HG001]